MVCVYRQVHWRAVVINRSKEESQVMVRETQSLQGGGMGLCLGQQNAGL